MRLHNFTYINSKLSEIPKSQTIYTKKQGKCDLLKTVCRLFSLYWKYKNYIILSRKENYRYFTEISCIIRNTDDHNDTRIIFSLLSFLNYSSTFTSFIPLDSLSNDQLATENSSS